MGDTSADAVWRTLDAALDTVFPLADGRKLQVAATAVDSGFSADQVMKFVHARRRKNFLTTAVKGASGFDRLPLTVGGKLKGQMRLMIVGLDAVIQLVHHAISKCVHPGISGLPSG
jgi:phage terminase large subunit GpA-like protein